MRTIRNMKLHPLLILGAACLHLVLLAIVLSVPDARGSKGKGDVQAKLTYCEECHGSGGQA
jgi:cytochrome c553